MTNRNLQRMIHAGCKQLGLDEDTRHDLQRVATGKSSLSAMTDADLLKVVEALKQRGFTPTGNSYFQGRKGPFKRALKGKAARADVRFIHVLWTQLAAAGALKSPDRAGLNAFIRARFEGKWAAVPIDVDAMHDPGQINDVIRALKDWCKREGVSIK